MAPIVLGTLELHPLVVWWRMLRVIFLTGVVFMFGGGVFVGGAISVGVVLGGGNEGRCLLPGSGGCKLQAAVPSSSMAVDALPTTSTRVRRKLPSILAPVTISVQALLALVAQHRDLFLVAASAWSPPATHVSQFCSLVAGGVLHACVSTGQIMHAADACVSTGQIMHAAEPKFGLFAGTYFG